MGNSENKILKFQPKHNSSLSTDEIVKVFLGLVKLIRKSAEHDAMEKVKNSIREYKNKLNETTKQLEKRTIQVEQLLQVNENLMSMVNENNNKLL